ncbi:DUF4097 family beta strand repeat-containing protein [Parapedobacter deserti]|uniref:DUF4097 family beta strand repeat-containing protein n=1 Tax=Parapedobacter deserti TaxID=1912957 RepID=A0ABV7JUL9_9SPHI
MKKQTITLALFLSLCFSAWAQKEYSIKKNTGTLRLNLTGAIIEGYEGNEIIFSSQRAPEEEDERAKGLQALSSLGYKDNTGLGISVTDKGQHVEVNLVGNSRRNDVLKIKVPNRMNVTFNNEKSIFVDTLHIKNIKGELEVSTSYNGIILENNSGPMNVKTVYRDVEASFANDIKGPISIISVYGHVDVAIPKATKANLTLGTSYGKLYAADELDISITPKEDGRDDVGITSADAKPSVRNVYIPVNGERLAVNVGGGRGAVILSDSLSALGAISIRGFAAGGSEPENIEGTINGGGTNLILKSTYRNVYLRTK